MIDRYAIFTEPNYLSRKWQIKLDHRYAPTYNGAPTKQLPVITSLENDRLSYAYWGLLPEIAKSKPVSPRLFNLSWEKAITSSMQRKNLVTQRALIPANGFYFWKQIGRKQQIPHYCCKANQDLLCMAGIWSWFDDADGRRQLVFTLLTQPGTGELENEFEELPLLIADEKFADWLNVEIEIGNLAKCFEKIQLTDLSHHPVSPGIQDINYDDPKLIEIVNPSDQHGNYTLFD